jgi:hypothetical protein
MHLATGLWNCINTIVQDSMANHSGLVPWVASQVWWQLRNAWSLIQTKSKKNSQMGCLVSLSKQWIIDDPTEALRKSQLGTFDGPKMCRLDYWDTAVWLDIRAVEVSAEYKIVSSETNNSETMDERHGVQAWGIPQVLSTIWIIMKILT